MNKPTLLPPKPIVFGDYLAFFDESGDAQLASIDLQYPVFVLACCLIKKSDYTHLLIPKLSEFKLNFWGHDAVVLHEQEIRKPNAEYSFLFNPIIRHNFMSKLDTLVKEIPFKVIACVVNKPSLKAKYATPYDPYNLCLRFILERAIMWLYEQGQKDKLIHLFAECRGKTEDESLELEYRRIADGRHNWQPAKFAVNFDVVPTELLFKPKVANLAGLQLADLIARPIGLKVLRPEQPNRAYDTVHTKLVCGPNGKPESYGLKIFP
jgi:hypothetical protein